MDAYTNISYVSETDELHGDSNSGYTDLAEHRGYSYCTDHGGYTDISAVSAYTDLNGLRDSTGLTQEHDYTDLTELCDYSEISQTTSQPITTPDPAEKVSGSLCVRKKYILCVSVIIVVVILIGATVAGVLLTNKNTGKGAVQAVGRHSFPTTNTTFRPEIETSEAVTTAATRSSTSPTVLNIGIWLEWAAWTSCDVACGEGVHTRYRTCDKVTQSESPCEGVCVERKVCQSAKCPGYGRWTTWSAWFICSVTCGGGMQTRSRTCTKNSTTDNECIGDTRKKRECNTETCPDCSRICSMGALNAECDTCVCNTTTITLKVKSSKGVQINGAYVYASTAPSKVLSTTNDAGVVTLQSTCLNSEAVVTKQSYHETIVTMNVTLLDVVLEHIEFPHFEQEPISKARLVGESATLCCVALGNPDITYYEWFLGDNQLPKTSYPNGTHLVLDSLQVSNSGLYKCRANSDAGSAFSVQAMLTVKTHSSAFCEDALTERFVSLPSDCVQADTNTTKYNVGACSPKSCRQGGSLDDGSCGNTNFSVCQTSRTEMVTVQCTKYELEYVFITACACSDYVEPTVIISGIASGVKTGNPVRYGNVLVDGVHYGYTSTSGFFSVSVSVQKAAVTITLLDDYVKEFLDMTKRILIDENSPESIIININMIKATKPIVLDSSRENNLYIGINASDSNAVAEITIPSDSYYSNDGTRYIGMVKASLTFIDPTDENNSDNFPVEFQYVNDEGTLTNLESLGVFSLKLYDSIDNEINFSQSVTLSFNDGLVGSGTPGFDIWGLNEATGVWELANNNAETVLRKKRDLTNIDFDPMRYSWLNIAKPTRGKTCYFTPTVYETSQLGTEINFIHLQMFYYIKRGLSAIYSSDILNKPLKPCFEIVCENEDGVIDIYSEQSRVENRNIIPSTTSGLTASDNGRRLHIRLNADDVNGSLYSTRTKCEASDAKSLKYYLLSANKDVYTFKTVVGKTSTFPTPDMFTVADKKVWFYDHGRATRSCHIKVSIDNPLSGRTIKIRAMSKVGSLSGYVNEILGIREVEYNNATGDTCIEYRCSNDEDTTYVIVSLIYQLNSDEAGIYTVVNETSDLITAVSGSISQISKETFEVYMPQSTVTGIYKHDTTGYIEDQPETAKLDTVVHVIQASENECKIGTKSAVTFSRS